MISRSKIQFVISLQRKKVRDKEKLFVIEGDKMVREYLMSEKPVRYLIAKPEFISSIPAGLAGRAEETIPVSFDDLRKISTLKTPHNAIAVVPVPEAEPAHDIVPAGLCAALDFIQDPGNLGTIIRAAAWFGIKDIICSNECVDLYNPKVIQATMGAFLNVTVRYSDLSVFLENARKQGLPVYATLTEGEPVYETGLTDTGVILLGNESRGISGELLQYVTTRLSIPKFTKARYGIDSLNVGMAAAVVFSEFARRTYSK
ncbi:MAG: RNA methyltransferase [Bacteroidales bacterium]|nr:RNA methyltransferase [Bacteroidales bacterium]